MLEKVLLVNSVLIRVDSSTRIGTGHAMRCLTLANQLREQGRVVTFVARALLGNINRKIKDEGFELLELPATSKDDQNLGDSDYAAWLGASQEQDRLETLRAIGDRKFKWLVIDHYALDAAWESPMREVARKIMVIDDLANRQHDCDLLLDQNFYLDAHARYQNLVPPTATCLLGPEYALLRPEFYEARANLRERNGEVKRVLVCMGGSDPDNVTGKVVEALKAKAFSKLEIDVVVGPSNPHARSIESQISGRANFHLLQDAPNMAELMADADFAIGGGGSMTWERALSGLPSLVFVAAPNQEAVLKDIGKLGLSVVLDAKERYESPTQLQKRITSIIRDRILIKVMSDLSFQLKVGSQIGSLQSFLVGQFDAVSLNLRPLTQYDAYLLLNLHLNLSWEHALAEIEKSPNDIIKPSEGNQSGFTDRVGLYVVESDFGSVGCIQLRWKKPVWTIQCFLINQFDDTTLRKKLWNLGLTLLKDCGAYLLLSKDELVNTGNPTKKTEIGVSPSHICGKNAWDCDDQKRQSEEPSLHVSLLFDRDSWTSTLVNELGVFFLGLGINVRILTSLDVDVSGDVCFILGYEKILSKENLRLHKHNLVVHESNLPEGRGWSPVTWQVLSGSNQICVCLIEADHPVDSGSIYAKTLIQLSDTDLLSDIRVKQAHATRLLCSAFVANYPTSALNSSEQRGAATHFRKRFPRDSALAIDKPLRDQWNLLRICDPDRYPSYVEIYGKKFEISIKPLGQVE